MTLPAPRTARDGVRYEPPAGAPARPVVRHATPDDDAGIRALLREATIPGAVTVAFTREPRYAAGEGLAGAHDVAVVARHAGAVVGLGRASILPLHVGGVPVPVAYLGELRLRPGVPWAPRLLREGYARLAEAIRAAGCAATVTSIADDNVRARRVLAHGGRLGLPAYAPLASLVTCLVPVPRAPARDDGAHRLRDDDERAQGDALLARAARAHDLALGWDARTWAAAARHGLDAAHRCVVRRHGRVVATAACWDQRAFRQVQVVALSGWLARTRPLVDAWGALRGLPPLPRAGAPLAQAMVAAAAVERPGDWPALLAALAPAARAAGVRHLAIARDARDPELDVLRRLPGVRTWRTTLHDVRWRGAPGGLAPSPRLVRPEVALL